MGMSIIPSIEVQIGGQTRLYHAFVTTATPALDGPSTLTLHAATLADMSGLAIEVIVPELSSSALPARLVLIETRELAWHRANYKAAHCLCSPVDPVLVSLKTLQYWLWLRLQTPNACEVHA